MTQMTLIGRIWLPLLVSLAVAGRATAQPALIDVMTRHGVELPGKSFEAAFDQGLVPIVPVTPGSFATPLAMLAAGTGGDRIAAAYAFGILAGRSAKAISPQELAAAGQPLLQMIGSDDRRSRIVAARVAGRLFAAPFDPSATRPVVPAGLIDSLFALWNRPGEFEQLAAMDALGLVREATAVSALIERYQFYRDDGQRALAGGAIEALARIGQPAAADLVRLVAADRWAEGHDATALAVAFARERLLNDGSIVILQQALNDRSRRAQARGYLGELGAPVP